MSSLIGQNIGGNPRGILNLGATINTPLDTTLRNVTDGLGNNSPLQLSTTDSAIVTNGVRGLIFEQDLGSATASSRLLFRNNTSLFSISLSGAELGFRTGAVLGNTSGTLSFKYSASGVTIGTDTTNLARLHVRGDGTNPIARFENSSGSNAWAITSGGTALTCEGQARIQGPAIANDSSVVLGSYNNLTTTSLTQTILNIQGNIVCAAGSGNKRISSIEYGINNSGAQTGTATGIFLNATETALNGMAHNLMDLQVGNVSAFRVDKNDAYVGIYGTGSTKLYLNGTNGTRPFIGTNAFQLAIDMGSYNFNIARLGNNHMIFQNNGNHTLNLIAGSLTQFGGTTNAFPAIKRNGAAIEARLADDSNYTDINAFNFNLENNGYIGSRTNSGFRISFTGTGFINHTAPNGHSFNRETIVGASSGSLNASAILQADSTTKGFLPPRLTTAQRDLIGTPAAGLMIYNTSTNRPNFYDGSAWVAL